MSKAAWFHIYQLVLMAGLIAVWRIQGTDGWVFHWYLSVVFSLSILLHLLSLVRLSFDTHKHTQARCIICRERAHYAGETR